MMQFERLFVPQLARLPAGACAVAALCANQVPSPASAIFSSSMQPAEYYGTPSGIIYFDETLGIDPPPPLAYAPHGDSWTEYVEGGPYEIFKVLQRTLKQRDVELGRGIAKGWDFVRGWTHGQASPIIMV